MNKGRSWKVFCEKKEMKTDFRAILDLAEKVIRTVKVLVTEESKKVRRKPKKTRRDK